MKKFWIPAALMMLTLLLAACSEAALPGCEAGSILLADGTLLSPTALTAWDAANPPVAVIALADADGAALALGVHHSGEPLMWAMDADGVSPAFAFAEHYAQAYGLPDALADGWRMPEIEELTAIYGNREAINTALQSIYALDSTAAANGLGTHWYWAATPSATQEGYAWFIHFYNGYAADCPQDFTNVHALAVRTL